jgi:hypothetical protein
MGMGGNSTDDLIDEFLDFLCDTGIGDLAAGPPKKFAGFFEEHCEVTRLLHCACASVLIRDDLLHCASASAGIQEP